MQYRLRTLLIVLAIGPPLLAEAWSVGAKALADYQARNSLVVWEDVGGPGVICIYDGSICTLTIDDVEIASDELDD